jgi:hypothetical protein
MVLVESVPLKNQMRNLARKSGGADCKAKKTDRAGTKSGRAMAISGGIKKSGWAAPKPVRGEKQIDLETEKSGG